MTLHAATTPKNGAVYTRRWVAETILDLVGYTVDAPLEEWRIVEPAAGDGSFLVPMLDRLIARARNRNISLRSLVDAVCAWDIDPGNAATCRQIVVDALLKAGADQDVSSLIAGTWIQCGDYLLAEPEPADVVVGNPPYIRWDELGDQRAALYRATCRTIRGRGDIYLGFWEKALESLRPGGRAGFICADRWMRNSYGADLRAMVGNGFDVEAVWTMHDVDAFHEKVMAYPAITVIGRATGRAPVVVSTTSEFGEAESRQAARFTLGSAESGSGEGWRGHRLDHWYTGRGLWPSAAPDTLALLDSLADLPTLEESGCRIGIGLASGCDARFVVDDVPEVELDRLLPMTMGSDLNGTLHWGGHYLVNPWGPDGRLVDLDAYPLLRKWLDVPEVRNRFVSRKQPQNWFRTIDKVIPGLTSREKLLIADMRPRLSPYLETGEAYPHHNVYWITSDRWDLEVLGGLLLSDIASAFVEAYCVRMAGGTLRLQAQYLRTIRVPLSDTISGGDANALRESFRSRDREKASRVAHDLYGVS